MHALGAIRRDELLGAFASSSEPAREEAESSDRTPGWDRARTRRGEGRSVDSEAGRTDWKIESRTWIIEAPNSIAQCWFSHLGRMYKL